MSTQEAHSVHISIYKWRTGAPLSEIEGVLSTVAGLAGDVAGIRSVTWGKNTSEHGKGFGHAVLIIGDTPETVGAFRNLAREEPTVKLFKVWEEDGLAVDFTHPDN